LNSGIIHGGKADSGKVGLNWYPNSRFRVMANFIHLFELETSLVPSARSTAFNNTHPDIFELRTQVDF
jgi:phosphate-selective porin OprO/OprP